MHIRCPHCHNPIEVLEESTLVDVDCPTCGSGFNMASDAVTAMEADGSARRIAQFQLLERLGAGGFGTVWKAQNTELDRIVAIKIPRTTELDESEAEFFLREARAAAQLAHPNMREHPRGGSRRADSVHRQRAHRRHGSQGTARRMVVHSA
jgi:serine/threonine protein kinase